DGEQGRGVSRLLETLGDHQRDMLAVEQDAVVLQQGKHGDLRRFGRPVEARRILMRHDRDDAGGGERLPGIDAADAAGGNPALHQCRIGEALDRDLGGIARIARELGGAFDSGEVGADEIAHACSPSVTSARSTVFCSNGSLNPLCASGCAPALASAEAARKLSGLAGAPISTFSTAGSRQGLVPTPPAAIRASRMVPPSMASATAAEASANSKEARSRTLR